MTEIDSMKKKSERLTHILSAVTPTLTRYDQDLLSEICKSHAKLSRLIREVTLETQRFDLEIRSMDDPN